MPYNQKYKLNPKVIGSVASVNMRYENLVALANLIQDVHLELAKPEDERFHNYPITLVESAHQEIHDACVNAFMSLEVAHPNG